MIPGTRRSHADDIAASLVIAVTAFVQDEHERVLIQRGADGRWHLPGGAREPSEALGRAIIRILADVGGMTVATLGLVGIYDEPHHATGRSGSGPCRQVSVCLRARPLGRQPAFGPDLRWAAHEDLDALPMHDSTRVRIDHGFDERPTPHIEARAHRPGAPRCFPWPGRRR